MKDIPQYQYEGLLLMLIVCAICIVYGIILRKYYKNKK
jgi:membrane-bound acyltransferase YfiQ involved in biofilm formation